MSILVTIYRETERGLAKVATQEVPDAVSATAELEAWRTYTRSNTLPPGIYQSLRNGKRFRMEQRTSYQSTDLGVAS